MRRQETTRLIKCLRCGSTNRVLSKMTGAAVCGQCKTPLLLNPGPIEITDANFTREVAQSPIPVLLDLWAEWCTPCRMLTPIIEEIAGEMAGKVKVGKLNVDDNPKVAARFRVQGIPTLLVLENGKEIKRMAGVQSKAAILRQLVQSADTNG